MEALVKVGLTNAALAALLAVPALLATRLMRRRPAVAHALWLLVLLKLVTPPLIVLPVWPSRAPEAAHSAQAVEGPLAPHSAGDVALEDADDEKEAPAPPPWPLELYLACLWLAGSAVYLLTAWLRMRRLGRLLASLPEAEAGVASLASRLGLSRAPRVLLAPGRIPPMLSAAWGPACIVLPRDLWSRLGPAEREAVLLHELAHLARGDHWVRRLELVVLALYWWCPVAWLACREVRRAEEECCDAWVTWASPESGPAYAGALVETAAFLAGECRLPIGACGAAAFDSLKRRLAMILEGRLPRGLSLVGLALVALFALGLPLAPAEAAPPQPEVSEAQDPEAPLPDILKLVIGKPAPVVMPFNPVQSKEELERMLSEVLKQLRDLEKKRAGLAQVEQRLKEALKSLELKGTPAKGPAPSRLEQLENQLREIEKELKALREAARGKGKANAEKYDLKLQIEDAMKAHLDRVKEAQEADRKLREKQLEMLIKEWQMLERDKGGTSLKPKLPPRK
jgi:beta-lactamase regulating signal transducer with metallopeptidase domain